jgi:RNA polymerase sigma factor (sigma-70 family)
MPERIAQLSAAMAVGDSEAVDAFYREYFDWMYGQARRVTRRDESFCLDVVQDAVLRVIRTVKPVDEEVRFRGWLQLVVKTTAFDLLRGERRRRNREAMASVVPTTAEPDVDSLQLDWLAEQINGLDPEIVKIIELRFQQSWTLRRIGERLGVSISVVDGRLRRALTHLRLAAETPPSIVETTPAAKNDASRTEPNSLVPVSEAAADVLPGDAASPAQVDTGPLLAYPGAVLEPQVLEPPEDAEPAINASSVESVTTPESPVTAPTELTGSDLVSAVVESSPSTAEPVRVESAVEQTKAVPPGGVETPDVETPDVETPEAEAREADDAEVLAVTTLLVTAPLTGVDVKEEVWTGAVPAMAMSDMQAPDEQVSSAEFEPNDQAMAAEPTGSNVSRIDQPPSGESRSIERIEPIVLQPANNDAMADLSQKTAGRETPAIAARSAVADATRLSLRDHAFPVSAGQFQPASPSSMPNLSQQESMQLFPVEHLELIGMEDEAGWYDDRL